MLIYIEDYLNRRRQSRPQAEPLLVAVGGVVAGTQMESAPARAFGPLHAAVLVSNPDADFPAASELAALFAEASLI